MVEIVDWQNINEQHRFQTVETWSSDNTNNPPPAHCWICGKHQDEHWFPPDLQRIVDTTLEIEKIAQDAWDNNEH